MAMVELTDFAGWRALPPLPLLLCPPLNFPMVGAKSNVNDIEGHAAVIALFDEVIARQSR